MSEREKNSIIENVAATMEIEGFQITQEQRNEWKQVLNGEITMDTLLAKHKQEAMAYGAMHG